MIRLKCVHLLFYMFSQICCLACIRTRLCCLCVHPSNKCLTSSVFFEACDLSLMPPHFKIIISFFQSRWHWWSQKEPRWKRQGAFQVDLLSAPGRPVGDGVCWSIAMGPCVSFSGQWSARPPIGLRQSFNRQSQPAFVPLSLTAVLPPEKVIGPPLKRRGMGHWQVWSITYVVKYHEAHLVVRSKCKERFRCF